MKTSSSIFKITIIFLLSCCFIIHVVSTSSPDGIMCSLNFTSFPYQPTGDCMGGGYHEKINAWDSIPISLCCQNALAALSQALAVQANDTRDSPIFLEDSQWNNCSQSFVPQRFVSIHSCGFDDLYHGSSVCSSLSFSSLANEEPIQVAQKACFSFDTLSFDDACDNCTHAIKAARDHILIQNKVTGNGTEKSICGIAIVTSLAASNIGNRPLIEDFYRCLTAFDTFEPGYIKIQYSMAKTILAVILASIGITLVIILVKYVTKNKPRKPSEFKETSKWSGLYRFSKAEIENAIYYFGPEGKSLGHGSAGQVYKGQLPSGQFVAIKHIFKSNTSDSFSREVDGLSRVRHPNLVCLFGCCVEDGDQYLVYEYCSAGNLAEHLLRKDTLLTWERRVRILRNCALGLRHLHHYIDGCIVHRDIKLTNILLTENLEPKLSDFGLARMLGMEESKVFTDVRGTLGYMDPEYMSNAKLTCASDIYSYGIVALQLLSGQKVFELDLDARDQLTRKAKDVHMGKRSMMDIIDPRLNGDVNSVDFEAILKVAVLCVAKSSKGRPTIDVVFEEIDKAFKNTLADMRVKREMNSGATSQHSNSIEVVAL